MRATACRALFYRDIWVSGSKALDKFSCQNDTLGMPSNNPDYARAYNLTHRKAIKLRKRKYYLKNRERILAAQTIRNRKALDIRRAARASQKPARKTVRGVSQADADRSRDKAQVGWKTISGPDEYGNAVHELSRDGSPDGAETYGGVFTTASDSGAEAGENPREAE